ncbi:hypothetical protein [Aeoliella straminimaris]|uniref:hypothetical protein n=1 Tax=Aeoliella straminimaris TaxID=2954799 RepID=UPI0020934615|nr:hypothetical protein [Aeoliella straminimaris]
MEANSPDNPYASPEKLGSASRPTERRRWLLTTKLALWSLAFFVLTCASVQAGFVHYHYLQRGFDYRNGDSRELARLTESAIYWLIPALGCLLASFLLGIAAIGSFLLKLFR